ncbi:serine/arginine-rich SC35-like splicing factor SCL33 [Tripterygium wilfordii]|uniref:serine/arginine-rich SC35-like splicing factor SCL33 n=1 Tax=Tripterygium wilfordii TaxID=458696 RepID=UPI0018F8400E|nr:serine/arginine-rich SC35-like splicing factor SCL33 [Tripterygium wilfordii]XP_038696766.1 serine/arginine-rich SC35-like splicing factor SCL33 [Tripterygium wilfordii]
MRGRSYSPSPPRGYGRRGRSPSPRGRYGGRGSRDLPTSLLVRNLRHDCRQEDLRRPFGRFGPLKDIYLPRNYHTGEPRGFGFIQFVDPSDAVEAKHHMDGQVLLGRELTVVFAEENRKKPTEMRARERPSSRYDDRRRSAPRDSRSPPPRYARSRSRSQDYYSPAPKRRQYSRSVSPQERRYSRERSYTHSPAFDGSRNRSQSPQRVQNRSRSQSPVRIRSRSPVRSRSRSPIRGRSQSPIQGRSQSPIRGRSFSPNGDYSREPKGRSPSQ